MNTVLHMWVHQFLSKEEGQPLLLTLLGEHEMLQNTSLVPLPRRKGSNECTLRTPCTACVLLCCLSRKYQGGGTAP